MLAYSIWENIDETAQVLGRSPPGFSKLPQFGALVWPFVEETGLSHVENFHSETTTRVNVMSSTCDTTAGGYWHV